MLKEIDKRGKLLVKLQCDICHWSKWMKPKRLPKYPSCPQCIVNLNKRLQEVKELQETEVAFTEQIVELDGSNFVEGIVTKKEIEQAPTEIIKKSTKKHK